MCVCVHYRALHIAVVQGELAIFFKLIHLLLWAHRSLDIYNNLRQVIVKFVTFLSIQAQMHRLTAASSGFLRVQNSNQQFEFDVAPIQSTERFLQCVSSICNTYERGLRICQCNMMKERRRIEELTGTSAPSTTACKTHSPASPF